MYFCSLGYHACIVTVSPEKLPRSKYAPVSDKFCHNKRRWWFFRHSRLYLRAGEVNFVLLRPLLLQKVEMFS